MTMTMHDFVDLEHVKAAILRGVNINNTILRCDNWTPLMRASCECDIDIVTLLLDNGADPNINFGGESETALFYAAYENNIEIIKILLDWGADPSVISRDGTKYSAHVAWDRYDEIVEYEKNTCIKPAKK